MLHVHYREAEARFASYPHFAIVHACTNQQIKSAEVPDEELYKIVKSTMSHRPCENLNRNSPYMDGVLSCKRYPYSLTKIITQITDDSYSQYHR